MRRVFLVIALVMSAAFTFGATASAAKPDNDNCMVPRGGDVDNNGIGDAGVQVVCNYDSVYAYDASGSYYWDLGDGRVYTSPATVDSINDLEQATLSVCDYRIHTKGDFNNDPFMDTGDISNMIHCYGADGNGAYHYQIVSSDDPRYTGNPDWSIWGTWEYHVLTESGSGNLVHTTVAHLNNPHS